MAVGGRLAARCAAAEACNPLPPTCPVVLCKKMAGLPVLAGLGLGCTQRAPGRVLRSSPASLRSEPACARTRSRSLNRLPALLVSPLGLIKRSRGAFLSGERALRYFDDFGIPAMIGLF